MTAFIEHLCNLLGCAPDELTFLWSSKMGLRVTATCAGLTLDPLFIYNEFFAAREQSLNLDELQIAVLKLIYG